jgi:hypothetical protein
MISLCISALYMTLRFSLLLHVLDDLSRITPVAIRSAHAAFAQVSLLMFSNRFSPVLTDIGVPN